MTNVTAVQKRILISGFIVAAACVIFWIFVYLPSKETVSEIKEELAGIQRQIDEIKVIVGEDRSLEESITMSRERFEELDAKFPAKEEESLEKISEFSRQLNIELLAIRPKPKKAFVSADNDSLSLEGKACQNLFVSIRIKCRYEDLVEYIKLLKAELPSLVTVEKLDIVIDRTKRSEGLSINLGFNFYLVS